MQDLVDAPRAAFANVRFLLTDMDETLTYRGRLAARTYDALERLQQAGVVVIPVTAAPAGWCDQMARMWPVDGVIAVNGGLYLQRQAHGALRRFWNAGEAAAIAERLVVIAGQIEKAFSFAVLADDQSFRLASVAFQRPQAEAESKAILNALRAAGADATVNNLWVLGWLGGFDKLLMARRVLAEQFAFDIDANTDAVMYCGDSVNDAPMFVHFQHTIGVSTVRQHLHDIAAPPRWITQGPGGDGFVEAADALLESKGAR